MEGALSLLSSEAKEEIEAQCRREDSAWTMMENRKWALFRYSNRYNKDSRKDELGVLIALDGNLGSIQRGAILVPHEEIKAESYTRQAPSPYAHQSVHEISETASTRLSFSAEGRDSKSQEFHSVDVLWATPYTDVIDVDLVVDFGNTRTVALLLQDLPGDDGRTHTLRERVRPLRFVPRGKELSEFEEWPEIMDSWFVLHQGLFSDFAPPDLPEGDAVPELIVEQKKTGLFKREPMATGIIRRVPQLFVELSPIMAGEDAGPALQRADFSGGGLCFLSSPKRYAWDAELEQKGSGRVPWTMLRNDWHGNQQSLANAKLSGQVFYFLPEDGSDWDADSPPNLLPPHQRPSGQPNNPVYPRADTVTWMALYIIEMAHRQINAEAFWKNDYPLFPRRLRSIQVTYPSGWTSQELEAYQRKWQKAVNVFSLGHLEDPASGPRLEFPLDEAVASQLPVVFGEMQAMNSLGDNWLELIGRPTETPEDGHASHRARVMTIDIGGGTADYAVVEYGDELAGAGINLEGVLLFKDSSTTAGDNLIKSIIEKVLLPTLLHRFSEHPDILDEFRDFFADPHALQVHREEWKRITRLVFVPKVTQWLGDLSAKRQPSVRNSGPDNQPVMQAKGLRELARMLRDRKLDPDLVPENAEIIVEQSALETVIADHFRPLLQSLTKYVVAFQVDQVVLSGKPSELPIVTKLMKEMMPLPTHRLISAKNFHAGTWYPFSKGGKITDAKTITACGLALNGAISRGMINGWSIKTRLQSTLRNIWVEIPANAPYGGGTLLEADADEGTCTLMTGTRIGRKILPSIQKPEAVYILKWRGLGAPPPSVEVTLRRARPDGDGYAEHLQLINVEGPSGHPPLAEGDIQLKLCTLETEDYWLDNPCFYIS